MSSFELDVMTLKAKPPFHECKTFDYFPDTRQVRMELTYPAPHEIVSLRLSQQYVECYPHGEVSMMVGNHFHIIPVGSQVTLRELAAKIKDMCVQQMHSSIGTEFGAPLESPEPMMEQNSTEWQIEPTVDIGSAQSDGACLGINTFLLADITAAKSAPHVVVVMKDQPAINKTSVIVMISVAKLINVTTAQAWNLVHNEPLQLHFTCDRQKYLDAPVEVRVGQAHHFATGLFHGMAGQLTLILMNGFCREVQQQERAAANERSPVDTLCDFGCSPEVAAKALELTKGHLSQAINIVVNCTTEEIMSGDAIATSAPVSGRTVIETKRLPPSTHGFFARAADYVLQRLPTAPEFCVMCDQPHIFAQGHMLQPSVCTRDICMFKFQELNVAREAANSVAMQPGVVDLLLNCARSASHSSRWEVIFDPFPHFCETGDGKRDITAARAILSSIPTMKSMAPSVGKGPIKSVLDAAHPQAYAMFQWVMNSSKSFLLKLPSDSLINFMGTPHQYILATAPPLRQKRFDELKAQHKSVWVFHGSRLENWHSILRNGLKNASGSKLQVNGAAYGNGIYLSPAASVSFGYSGISTGDSAGSARTELDREFHDPTSMLCIAICEVIDNDLRRNGNIYVQPHEDHVMTRFFFVFNMGLSRGGNADLTNPVFYSELERATAKFIR